VTRAIGDGRENRMLVKWARGGGSGPSRWV
jgi:hypothetical protein